MVGLWPYQQSKLVQFQLILFFGILISFHVSQVHSHLWSLCVLLFLVFYF